MLFVSEVKQSRWIEGPVADFDSGILKRLYHQRSDIPAITHIDFSARMQTVHQKTNPRFYQLLKAFADLSGCHLLVNTSFNVRGEPIVCTPEDAYRCFMSTEMDYLVIGNYLFSKEDQPILPEIEKGAKVMD